MTCSLLYTFTKHVFARSETEPFGEVERRGNHVTSTTMFAIMQLVAGLPRFDLRQSAHLFARNDGSEITAQVNRIPNESQDENINVGFLAYSLMLMRSEHRPTTTRRDLTCNYINQTGNIAVNDQSSAEKAFS